MKQLFFISTFILVASLAKAQQRMLELLPSSQTGIKFRNDVIEDAYLFFYTYENMYNGGGVSIADINNDGLNDVYFSSNRGANRLYLNKGNFVFEDITVAAGVDGGSGFKTGINMVDVNEDGYTDIVVCKSGFQDPALRTKLVYINNKNNTFTDQAAQLGLNDQSYSTQSYFFDYDNDGDKDVYFVNHPIDFSKSMQIPATYKNGKLVLVEDTSSIFVSDRFYENRNGKFVDVTKKAGLINHAFGLSAAVGDINEDGWQDIIVCNDFNKADAVYINNKNGTFTNRMQNYFAYNSFSSMGSDLNDINNDGFLDFISVDMAPEQAARKKQLFALNQGYDKFYLMYNLGLYAQYPRNMIQINKGVGQFNEIAYHANAAETDWSWAPLMVDFDNDGFKDLYITNGLKRDVTDWDYKVFILDSVFKKMNAGQSVDLNSWLSSIPSTKIQNYLYQNTGKAALKNVSTTWLEDRPSFSNGAAYGDLDNDGDLDFIVNNVDDEAFVYRNNQETLSKNNFLRIQALVAQDKPVVVYGVSVTLYFNDGSLQHQVLHPQRGFESSVEHYLHFGLGKKTDINQIKIVFPNRKEILIDNVKVNQTLKVFQSEAKNSSPAVPTPSKIFTNVANNLSFTHKENEFIDFKREPLIPFQCSRKGPFYAYGDVNGDGIKDIYVGAAVGETASLLIGAANGSFVAKPQPAFATDKIYEDAGAIFIDADGDGDEDLFVTSGGAQFDAKDKRYQPRMYTNTKGVFSRALKAIPNLFVNSNVVVAIDYDNDGDKDILIGGGVVPKKFPFGEGLHLLQNNKGVFVDVTAQTLPIFKNIINAIQVADINKDGQLEIIVTGEWMGIEILEKVNEKYQRKLTTLSLENGTITLSQFNGWYNSLKTVDVDGDGDLDFVVGNRGTNCRIKAKQNEPATIYGKDFDGNGSYDAVLGYYIGGKCYPMYSRDFLIDQMPSFRKKYTRYALFSGKTMDEIFTTQEKTGMDVFLANNFESGIFINDGDWKFHFEALPEEAQFSLVNDFAFADFTGDGKLDILAVGNSNSPDVSTGFAASMPVALFAGNGSGAFNTIPPKLTGLDFSGEVRHLLHIPESKTVIFFRNNDKAITLKY